MPIGLHLRETVMTRSKLKTAVALAVAVALSMTVLGNLAYANHPDATSSLNLKKYGPGDDSLKGAVKSSDDLCEGPGRNVFLWRRNPNNGDILIDNTTTNGNGKYDFGGPFAPGRYYSRVEDEPVGTYTHVRTCFGARSNIVKLT